MRSILGRRTGDWKFDGETFLGSLWIFLGGRDGGRREYVFLK
jgi:hypothetical protein